MVLCADGAVLKTSDYSHCKIFFSLQAVGMPCQRGNQKNADDTFGTTANKHVRFM